MKKKFRISLAFAIVLCLLIAAVAFAETKFGVLDFIVGRYAEDIHVLPEASQIIQDDVKDTLVNTKSASFSVRQAVFDGKYGYVVVAVTPAEEGTLLLGLDSDPSMPLSDFGLRFEDDETPIADYARQTGERLVHTDVGPSSKSEISFDSIDYMLEDDKTLVYMLMGPYEGNGPDAKVELLCSTYDYIETNGEYQDDIDSMEKTTISFTLKAADIIGEARSVQAVDFPDCGVRVDEVKLTATPMAVYTEVLYSVIDEVKYAALDGGLWFEFLDENGERMLDGATAGSEQTPIDESETRFIQKGSIGAMEALPDSITLRGYSAWEKNRYSANEIALEQ